MTNASELPERTTEQDAWRWLDGMVESICDEAASDLTYSADQMVDAYMAGCSAAAPNLARQVIDLEAQLAEIQSRIAEQITHAKTRIADGDEMGARVWRIALEDIVRENSALLTQHKEPKSHERNPTRP